MNEMNIVLAKEAWDNLSNHHRNFIKRGKSLKLGENKENLEESKFNFDCLIFRKMVFVLPYYKYFKLLRSAMPVTTLDYAYCLTQLYFLSCLSLITKLHF